MSQYCVTALKKDWAILCGLRLVLEHLGTSEHVIITLKEYCYMVSYLSGGLRSGAYFSIFLQSLKLCE